MRQGTLWVIPHDAYDLCLVPGVLEGISLSQADIEMFDLRSRQHALHPRLALLEQGARLFVAPDGIFDGKDSQRLIPGLYAVASGHPSFSGGQRMIGQRSGWSSFGLQQGQGALVQDLPPCLAQFGVDHVADQLMCKAIAARATGPWSSCFLLAQHPTCDGLFQSLDPC